MTEEGAMNKEWLDELAAATNDELIEKLRFFSCDPYFYDLFDPLVEEIQKRLNKAEPVRRGRWLMPYVEIRRGGLWLSNPYCSECGEFATAYFNYCPSCGSKMEE